MTARGHFGWHELLTTDTKAAAVFYGKVAGWTTQAWDQDKAYVMFMCGKSSMGGVKALPADARRRGESRRWLPYVVTDDVEVAVWEAQRLGGKVVKNTESMPSIGTFAVLQDPFGAVFAVLQPAYKPKPQYPPPVGDFSWHELVTGDVSVAFRFYAALFGWQKNKATDMGPDIGPYQMYGWKGRDLGGIYKKAKHDPGPHRWLSYIRVRDAKAAADLATRSGGQVQVGPMEVPGGDWIATGVDPQGAEFAVHSVKKATARKRPSRKKPVKKKAAKKPPAKKKASKGKKRR